MTRDEAMSEVYRCADALAKAMTEAADTGLHVGVHMRSQFTMAAGKSMFTYFADVWATPIETFGDDPA
ncbi:MAG TPA: hypothetical protein VH020_09310 [Stellaceae bacterium]|jgi:hypothetical protein|nr:hypothetical protein [Stellaceae bacterium]